MRMLVDVDIITALLFDHPEDRIEIDALSDIMSDMKIERFCTVSCIEHVICVARDISGSDEFARAVITRLMRLVVPLDVQMDDVMAAMDSDMSEMDKAISALSAMRNGVDLILTGNPEAFSGSPVKVSLPSEFSS